MNQMKYQEFVKNLNKQNLRKFNEKWLEKLCKQYVLKHEQSSVPRLRNQPRDRTEFDNLQGRYLRRRHESGLHNKKIIRTEKENILMGCPFKSKVQQYKKIHGKKPQKVQETPPDYQIKPLSKLNRPYYSPQFGSWEIDLVFSMDEHIVRANQIYLFCININTKYLVVFPLRDKSAGQIKNALQILVKNYNVTNIRGDGEKGFNGNILKTFCQEKNITSFFTDSKFTNNNRVADSVIRTIRNGFGNDSGKFAYNDLMQQMQNQLFEIKKQQKKQGLMSFSPGNILMIHLDYSKTGH
ncbi:MAG: hypothetical protein EZS28_041267, partial [Streblomastix strix]